MNLGIEHLMLFIWMIGWGLACGTHDKACESTKSDKKLVYYLVLFFTWPHYLGY